MAERETIKLTVNGKIYEFTVGDDLEPWRLHSYDVYPWDTLVETLRGNWG